MTVTRRTPLPTGPATGRLVVAEHVLSPTRSALQASSGRHRSHEGLAFWLGRNLGTDTLVLAVAVPPTEHRVDGVFVDERAVLATTRAARTVGLGLVAQVHSHAESSGLHQFQEGRWVHVTNDALIVVPALVTIGATR